MGARHIQNTHRRAVANKQRRLAPDFDEDLALRSLIARYSPTAIYTETLTDASPTGADPVTAPDEPANTPTDIPVTPPPPAPIPTTTPVVPNTPTTVPPANNPTTPSPTAVVQPIDTASVPVQVSQTVQTTNGINIVTTPVASARTTTSILVSTRPLTTSASRSIDSSAASSSPSDTGGSGTNVGGIVGGIAGALLGLAVIVFAVQYLLKRRKRRDEDGAREFSANDFRNSAILLPDPPTHSETVERGYNPRPPSMVERRLASPAPTYNTSGPYGGPGGVEYGNMDQYGQYQSYGPGEIMNSPVTATSAHPMYSNQPYGQSPFSPMGSPVSPTAVLTRQPSSATQVSRQPSLGAVNGYPQGTAQPLSYPGQGAQAEYVDLDRSSVTPFQAAQYAEISQKLNSEVPAGLDTPAVNEFVRNGTPPAVLTSDASSPFADPLPAALLPGDSGNPAPQPRPLSDTVSVAQELDDFPVPPSPAHTRVDSTPPTLPEIHVGSRAASYDFSPPVSGTASGFPSGIAREYMPSPLANQFPVTPSPLASSFGIQSPPPAATEFVVAMPASAPAPSLAPPTTAPTGMKATEKRPDTVYDDGDAYGGF